MTTARCHSPRRTCGLNGAAHCHWLRRTLGFRTQTEGLRTKFRRGVKNLSAVKKPNEVVRRSQFLSRHKWVSRDPSFVGMTTAVGSTCFVIGLAEPSVSGRDFVIGSAEPAVSEHSVAK